GNKARIVAPTVIITGRIRSIPASGRARSSGSPFSCISSMKSNSTITWLTMTPMRLATPRNAMNPKGVPKFSAYEPVYWSSRVVEFRRVAGTAHLHRGKNLFKCKVHGGAATGSSADLSTDHSAGFSRSFGRASGISERQGVWRAAGATHIFRPRCGPAFRDALSRRRHKLLGGADKRNQLF